jgi:hypothetical protein
VEDLYAPPCIWTWSICRINDREKCLSQCHSVHYKSHNARTKNRPRPLRLDASISTVIVIMEVSINRGGYHVSLVTLQSNACASTTFQLLVAEKYEVSVLDWPPVKCIQNICDIIFKSYAQKQYFDSRSKATAYNGTLLKQCSLHFLYCYLPHTKQRMNIYKL